MPDEVKTSVVAAVSAVARVRLERSVARSWWCFVGMLVW
jgi:hypothetical protein